jgi:hypothetical protein
MCVYVCTGKYTFYVDAATGAPVTFKMQGHNAVLGGSHSDEYWMDYLQVSDVMCTVDRSREIQRQNG